MRFGIYREVRQQPKEFWLHKAPTRIKTIDADTAYDAAVKFANTQPKGWRDLIIESNLNRKTATVWLRRFTPTGRYKGETKFLVWPIEK